MTTALANRPARPGDPLARGLGWASAGLGVPMLAAPGRFGQAISVGDGPRQRSATIVVGVRELAAAAGLLSQESPVWLWARVAGDLMDLGLLGRTLKNHDGPGWRRKAAEKHQPPRAPTTSAAVPAPPRRNGRASGPNSRS